MNSERYARGWAKLSEIHGEPGQKVLDALKDIAPDFATYIIEFPYGDIFSREGLDLKTRELATIAGLVALGHAQMELQVHIRAAIRAGCTRQEIVETIMHMAVYAGFPAALNGLFTAREVFGEQKAP